MSAVNANINKRLGFFSLLSTAFIFAMILGLLLLSERPTGFEVAGVVILFSAIALQNLNINFEKNPVVVGAGSASRG